MNCQEIVSSPHYAAMTLEQRGAVLGAYLFNVSSEGQPYHPENSGEGSLLEKMAISGDVVYGQLDCESLRVGYKVTWADQYLEACKSAGVFSGDKGIKTTSLVERSKTVSAEVGYKRLEGEYAGSLPTSRYDAIGQVFVITPAFVERLRSLCNVEEIKSLLSDYYDTLMLNPKIRPSASNMPISIARFIKKQANMAKGVDYAIMAALEMEDE